MREAPGVGFVRLAPRAETAAAVLPIGDGGHHMKEGDVVGKIGMTRAHKRMIVPPGYGVRHADNADGGCRLTLRRGGVGVDF